MLAGLHALKSYGCRVGECTQIQRVPKLFGTSRRRAPSGTCHLSTGLELDVFSSGLSRYGFGHELQISDHELQFWA